MYIGFDCYFDLQVWCVKENDGCFVWYVKFPRAYHGVALNQQTL